MHLFVSKIPHGISTYPQHHEKVRCIKLKNGGPVQTRTVIKRLTAARSDLWTTGPWSETRDSDPKPRHPKWLALPSCASFRKNLYGCGSGESNQTSVWRLWAFYVNRFTHPQYSGRCGRTCTFTLRVISTALKLFKLHTYLVSTLRIALRF